ncbi:MAG: hypothetical protein J7L12_04355 [Desulfurococcales archaeon]|nr:hypothetical protein [Desulfurococcales archaeon]
MTLIKIGYITDLNRKEEFGHALLVSLIKTYRVNAIIIGGDCNLDPQNLPLKGKVKYFILSGDKDDIYVTKTSRKLGNLLDGNITYLDNIAIAGVSGLDYYQSITKITKYLSERGSKVRVNILVTHHPPRGCLDRIEALNVRGGLGSVRDLIIKLKPDVALTGHLGNRGICYTDGVPVVNPGPAEEGFCTILEFSGSGVLQSILLLKLRLGK